MIVHFNGEGTQSFPQIPLKGSVALKSISSGVTIDLKSSLAPPPLLLNNHFYWIFHSTIQRGKLVLFFFFKKSTLFYISI